MTADRVESLVKLFIYFVLGFTILIALISVKAGDPGTDTLPCRPPHAGEKLVVTGSKDGKPFCIYYPIVGWGMTR